MFCTTSQVRGETRSSYRRLRCKINDARRFNIDKAPNSPGRVANVTHSTSLNCKRRFITSTNCVLSDYISHEHMVRPRSSRHSSRYRQSRVTHHSHACHTLYINTEFVKGRSISLESKCGTRLNRHFALLERNR